MKRELRDHLGELLAEALLDPVQVPPVHWLHAYCAVAHPRVQPIVPYREVMHCCLELADAFPFDPVGEPGAALMALDILELRRAGDAVRGKRIPPALAHGGWDLQILAEHREALGEVTIKARGFWNALRRLYERTSGPARGLEDALERATALFNAGLYFEFHEILEGYWMAQAKGPTRQFLQGLIQIAIGFYQIERQNAVGALAQFQKGLEKTEDLGDRYLGIELAGFLAAVRKCRDALAALGEGRIAEFDRSLVPPLQALRSARRAENRLDTPEPLW
jgi:predicted metal-dependent hydrolase